MKELKDKELKKKIEKIIKVSHSSERFYKVDKILRLQKVKAKKFRLEKELEGGNVYRVIYEYSFNRLNPLTWVIIMLVILYKVFELIRGILVELAHASEYSDAFKIKN